MKKIKIMALFSALIVAILVYYFLNTLSEPVVIEIAEKEVVVATQDIMPNIPITSEMIRVVKIHEDAIHAQSLRSINDVVGKISVSQIISGEQILSSKLILPGETTPDGTLAYSIEPGMRAITIAVGNVTGLSYMIIPGNHVDIIGQYAVSVTQPDGEEIEIDYTLMLLENIKVLAVDSNMSENQTAEYSSITLQVTPLQALETSMSEYKGNLRAILRSPLDDDITSLPILTIDNVIFKE